MSFVAPYWHNSEKQERNIRLELYKNLKGAAVKLASLDELEEVIPEAVFRAEVAVWARRIGIEPKQVQLRAMKNKWASCSNKGRLTFDPELLKKPAAFRAEVIVHELLHLKIPNHGPLFKAMLRSYLARYRS